jgi:AcrR family transcriptional regulator
MPKVVHHLFKPDEKHLEQIEESLLLSASDLAKDTAIENIEIEDIVNKAQVSPSTFYKVFHSVDGLFKKLGQRLTNELMEHVLSQTPEIADVASRVAIKTRKGLLIATQSPFLASLGLKAGWPSSNPDDILYKDIEKDFIEGVKQGYFTDISPSIGVNIILGCFRGGVRDILEKKHTAEYADKVIFQLLISLGVDSKTADKVSKSSATELPMPTKGLVSNVLSIQDRTKAD